MSVTTDAKASSSVIVSPIVTAHVPTAKIGISTDAQEEVTVSGIVKTFKLTLADAATARTFLDCFDLSGLRYDEVISGEVDEDTDTLDLKVKAGIEPFISDVVDNAVTTDVSAITLETWLTNELEAAFRVAFPTYLNGSTSVADTDNGVDYNGDNGEGAGAAQNAQIGEPLPPGATAQDAVSATTLASIVRDTIISSFSVNVDVSGTTAGSDFRAAFNSASQLLRASLYRQIAKASWEKYYTAGVPANGIGSGLPLLTGDKIVFAFDVDVAATTGGVQSGVPLPSARPNTILLNLGNRRVAFEIVMPIPEGESAGAVIAHA